MDWFGTEPAGLGIGLIGLVLNWSSGPSFLWVWGSRWFGWSTQPVRVLVRLVFKTLHTTAYLLNRNLTNLVINIIPKEVWSCKKP